jgi:hypothetical protein
MLTVGSDTAVEVHSTGSYATVVTASECWVSASEIGGTAFALASATGSSVVA